MNIQDQLSLIGRGAERIIDTAELVARLQQSAASGKPLIIKLGVDPTAPDIHLGHTVPLRKLRHFQDLGHEVCFLIGDFTGRIGDPTGRDKTRPPLTEGQILSNAKTYLEQVAKVLDVSRLRVVYNSHWLKDLNFGELIKMAAATTMSRLLEHNTFRERLASSNSIRMHELLYPFMQGYDSVALEADVELGGSDQTSNLTFGRDLQRFYGQQPQICIAMPILTGTNGVQKMSKSLGNYIGINEPPATMFDKLMRMVDSNILNYFTLLTDVPLEELQEIEAQLGSNSVSTEYILECKKRLAREIIAQYHGEEAAEAAVAGYGVADKDGLPLLALNGAVGTALNIPAMMVEKLGFKSLGEARRLIDGGGVSVNGEKLTAQECVLSEGDVSKCGKTKTYRIASTL